MLVFKENSVSVQFKSAFKKNNDKKYEKNDVSKQQSRK